ncbi:MAG TPA: malto-oligosyltrehalose trehalohydrolase [Candidatus Polarisedimenticolaceae bacterium]|nr:malto-oligosyltrehalose trehalohydrolase [Candidatus Polarisedimenticolaceae bacterium]
MALASVSRRLPVGAEVVPGLGVHARVWAPHARRVEAVLEGGAGAPAAVSLQAEPGGYFAAVLPGAAAGTRYRYRLDGEGAFADPASRFQPEGPEGPSEVVDPNAFRWTDAGWCGLTLPGLVLYEMHVGTFTPEGTLQAAAEKLAHLRQVGITAVELMPVADWVGRWGWGYDGVNLYAPTRNYGRPDDLRRFVDRAHALGLGVVLDVVYNHLGPRGNYLPRFGPYFHREKATDWGEALDYDSPESGPVREYFTANAGYWIAEYHMDGLRLDATQDIHDTSPRHVLADVSETARRAAGTRRVVLLTENEPQDARVVRPVAEGGFGLDAFWNDDFHHTAAVALTGRRQAYYTDYLGSPQELISTARWGFLFQGQRYSWQRKRRGSPVLSVPAPAFVTYLENHDQLANTLAGDRMHAVASPGRHRALTGWWLLAPGTPMLFQGQEWSATQPFLFFADHPPDLADIVRKGRAEFLSQFRHLVEAADAFVDPAAAETFERCKLDWSELPRRAPHLALHRDLLRLRREDPVFRRQDASRMHGAVLAPQAFLLRHLDEGGEDRLVLVNLGPDLRLNPCPEPLLAPPEGRRWKALWSSEDPAYGGRGAAHPEARPVASALAAARAFEEQEAETWILPGEATVVLQAVSA